MSENKNNVSVEADDAKEIDEIMKTLYYEESLMLEMVDSFKIAKVLHAANYRKRKKGRWIKLSPFGESVCSECKKSPKTLFGLLPAFCPRCGAEMESNEAAND